MPQKKSLRQIEKQQKRSERTERKETGKIEKTIGSIRISDVNREELIQNLSKMRAITPTGLANQYNVKVSVAKNMLEQLLDENVIELVSRSRNLKVYSLNVN
jgi:ribosomal protein S25